MGALGLGDAPGSPGPEKPKIALTAAKAEEPVVEAACDASWSAADVVKALCDALVATGKLRATPAFIRTDREAKLVKIFEKAKLDGAKLASFGNARELEIVIRNATQGEGWVDDVQKAMKTFLPADVQRAKVANAESEEAKKVKAAYRERAAAGGGRPGERPDGDRPADDAFASFGGRSGGGGGDRACYNCGQTGHISRDCPNPPSGQSADRDAAFASFGGRSGGGGDRACYNCGQTGHISRDCPNGPGGGRDDAFASFGGRGGGMGGDRACYNCGQTGHISRDCPNGGGGMGGGDRACYNCGEMGHISRDCPNAGGGGRY